MSPEGSCAESVVPIGWYWEVVEPLRAGPGGDDEVIKGISAWKGSMWFLGTLIPGRVGWYEKSEPGPWIWSILASVPQYQKQTNNKTKKNQLKTQ